VYVLANWPAECIDTYTLIISLVYSQSNKLPSPDSQQLLVLPPSLTPRQRAVLHAVGEAHHLSHTSEGDAEARHICLGCADGKKVETCKSVNDERLERSACTPSFLLHIRYVATLYFKFFCRSYDTQVHTHLHGHVHTHKFTHTSMAMFMFSTSVGGANEKVTSTNLWHSVDCNVPPGYVQPLVSQVDLSNLPPLSDQELCDLLATHLGLEVRVHSWCDTPFLKLLSITREQFCHLDGVWTYYLKPSPPIPPQGKHQGFKRNTLYQQYGLCSSCSMI